MSNSDIARIGHAVAVVIKESFLAGILDAHYISRRKIDDRRGMSNTAKSELA